MECTFFKREDIINFYPEDTFIFYDGLDDAIVGTCFVNSDRRVVYSFDKIIGCLIEQNNWTYDEAFDWFISNIECMHFSEHEPVILYDSF